MKKLLLILTSIGSVSAAGLPIQACGENDQSSTTTNNEQTPAGDEQSNPNENNEAPLPALSDVLTTTTLADIASAESKDIIDAIQSANTDLAAIADTNFTIEPIADDVAKVIVKVKNYEGSVEVSFTVKQALPALSDVLTQEIISKITNANESTLADEIKTLSTSLADKEIHITNNTAKGATIEVDGYTGTVDITFPTAAGLTGAMVDDLKNKGLWETISTSLGGDLTPDLNVLKSKTDLNVNLGDIADANAETIINAFYAKNNGLKDEIKNTYDANGDYSDVHLVLSEVNSSSAKVAVQYSWNAPTESIIGWEAPVTITYTSILDNIAEELTNGVDITADKLVSLNDEDQPFIGSYNPDDTTNGVEDIFRPWFDDKYKSNNASITSVSWASVDSVTVVDQSTNTYKVMAEKVVITCDDGSTKASKDVVNVEVTFRIDSPITM